MYRTEEVFREILFQSIEQKKYSLTQSELSKELNISLSVVNSAVKHLARMNAVKIKQRSLDVIDSRKILFYWASARNLETDILYKTRVEKPVIKIEAEMPHDIIYGAYSAYKFRYKEVPADYSEVYVYSNNIDEIKKRFPLYNKVPNLFVLRRDENLKEMTLANLFVDLWNLKEWYAKDFLAALEAKINGILE